MGRNPATGEAIKIKAKTTVKFRLAKGRQGCRCSTQAVVGTIEHKWVSGEQLTSDNKGYVQVDRWDRLSDMRNLVFKSSLALVEEPSVARIA